MGRRGQKNTAPKGRSETTIHTGLLLHLLHGWLFYIEFTGDAMAPSSRCKVSSNRLKLLAKVDNMKTKLMMSAIAATALIGLAGCGTSPTNAQIGTGVGAVAGGVVGNAVFGSTLGTVGGAAAGALIGNEVGKRR